MKNTRGRFLFFLVKSQQKVGKNIYIASCKTTGLANQGASYTAKIKNSEYQTNQSDNGH